MRQILFRIRESEIGPLMDQFVRRIVESSDEDDTKRVGVVAIFRRSSGKLEVLLGKRTCAPAAGKWAMPAGHCKAGESIEDGARREVKEETGLVVDKLTFFAKREGDEGDKATIFGTLYGGKGTPTPKDDEVSDFKWSDVTALPAGLAFDNNKQIPAIADKMELTEAAKPDFQAIFVQAMQQTTAEFMADEKSAVYGGGKPPGRRAETAFDINCGMCEEWAERVRELYTEKTGRDDVKIEVRDPFAPEQAEHGHVFVCFLGQCYDAECPTGVWQWRQLPVFRKQMGESQRVAALAEGESVLELRGYLRVGGVPNNYIRYYGKGAPFISVYYEDGWVDVDAVVQRGYARMFRVDKAQLMSLLDVLEPLVGGDVEWQTKYAQLRQLNLPYDSAEKEDEVRPISGWSGQRDSGDEQSFAEAAEPIVAKDFILAVHTPTLFKDLQPGDKFNFIEGTPGIKVDDLTWWCNGIRQLASADYLCYPSDWSEKTIGSYRRKRNTHERRSQYQRYNSKTAKKRFWEGSAALVARLLESKR